MALEFTVREYEHSVEKASLLSNILQILFKSCLLNVRYYLSSSMLHHTYAQTQTHTYY